MSEAVFPDRSQVLAHAFGGPVARARIKQQPQDFCVQEQLGYEPTRGGEHCYIEIEKVGANTAWVARSLAQYLGIAEMDVNYAGRKDRHAVTRQWFSCRVPGKSLPDLEPLALPGVKVLSVQRHNKKLRRGGHAGNSFQLRLRDVTDPDATLPRLAAIADKGFPNYFGEQRFGRGGSNLLAAEQLFRGQRLPRQQRELGLSAARSYLFNLELSRRLTAGELESVALPPHDWRTRDGRGAGRNGDDGCPPATDIPRGWLFGSSRTENPELAAIAAQYPGWCEGLVRCGLKAQQRDLWVRPADFAWHFEARDLCLAFGLPVGSFATSLIREIVAYDER